MGAPLAIFRCTASPSVGWGHLRRCQALSRVLGDAGWRCEFATAGECPAALREKWPDGAALLVTDGYEIDSVFEAACRPWAKRIVAIDDLANRPHDADILVDHNAGRTAEDYRHLVPEDCAIMTGPGFALLAPEFFRQRIERVPREAPQGRQRAIVVSLGGGAGEAQERAAGTILRALAALGEGVAVTVVGGSDPAQRNPKETAYRTLSGLTSSEMAQLLGEADLAIGAGGVSLLERFCVGLPSIVVTMAENQRRGTAAGAARGACADLGNAHDLVSDEIGRIVMRLTADKGAWIDTSRAAARTTDGLGAARVAASLASAAVRTTANPVTLRRATEEDAELLLAWQSYPQTRKYARNPAIPSAAEHSAWLLDRLGRGTCILNLIMWGRIPCGVLRLDRLSGDRSGYEVSVLTVPELQGRGIAREALRQARFLAGSADRWAWIDSENVRSQSLFAASGYLPQGNGWYRDTRELAA